MPADELVLLPPSAGKAAGGRGSWSPGSGRYGRRLGDARGLVAEAVAEAVGVGAGPAAAALLGVRGELLERAVEAAERARSGGAPVLPAWRRFTGVVWEHLDAATLPTADVRRIAVVWSLCGVSAGDDPVPDHRVPMGANVPTVGRLDRFWRPRVTEALGARRRSVVVDLLPGEHAAAVDLGALEQRHDVVRVRFVRAGGAAAGHAAKAAKGELARLVLSEGIDVAASAEAPGWRAHRVADGLVDVELSTP